MIWPLLLAAVGLVAALGIPILVALSIIMGGHMAHPLLVFAGFYALMAIVGLGIVRLAESDIEKFMVRCASLIIGSVAVFVFMNYLGYPL